jgi:hypothetical protein
VKNVHPICDATNLVMKLELQQPHLDQHDATEAHLGVAKLEAQAAGQNDLPSTA